MKKLISVAVLVLAVIGGLLVFPDNALAETPVHGFITSDTTWTKANSPYTLQGPVAVNSGVTLTIEPGVTVNLANQKIEVNGTLVARGTDMEKITFTNAGDSGRVSLTAPNQKASGSVFENTLTDRLDVTVPITVSNNYFKELNIGGSATATKNTIEALYAGENALVTDNDITQKCYTGGAKIKLNNIQCRVIGSGVISDNKILDGVHLDGLGGRVTIANNEIRSLNNYPQIFISGSHADITNNIIIGDLNNKPRQGILVQSVFSSATINGNQVYNCQTGIEVSGCTATVTKNIIANCDIGLTFALHEPLAGAVGSPWDTQSTLQIKSNTISKNAIGIQTGYFDGNATLSGNNIYDNTQYNFKLSQSQRDVQVAHNWWGTTDASAISQKIYDYQIDYTLGHVIVNPVLNSPATDAPALPRDIPLGTSPPTATPTTNPTNQSNASPPTQSQNPTATTNQPGSEFFSLNFIEAAILFVLMVIAALLVVLIVTLKRRR